MKNIFNIIFFLFIFCEFVNAQGRIQGVILEKANTPASFSTVALLAQKDSAIIKGRVAEDDGTFTFEKIPFGKYLISITQMGFKKKITNQIDLSEVNLMVMIPDIMLEEDSKILSEVVVKSQKPLVEKTADRLIINVENSVLATGNTGLEVLKNAPGIVVSPQGGISMRGKPNVMIMVDGKIVSKEVSNTFLDNMQGDNIAKIELITNPSAKYDAQASGGIINIITKKGQQQGLNGRLVLGGSQGVYGRMNSGIDLNYRKGDINIFGGLNFRRSKGFREESNNTNYLQSTIGESKDVFNNSFSNSKLYSPKVGIDYAINKNHSIELLAEGNFYNYDNGIDGNMNFRSNNQRIDSTLISTGTPTGFINLMNYNANYKGILDSKGREISVSAGYLDYQGEGRQSFFSQTYLPNNKPFNSLYQFRTITPSSIKVFTLQGDYSHPISKTAKVDLGFRYANTRSDNKNTQELFQENVWKSAGDNQTNYLEDVWAGYITYNKKFKDINMTLGLRTENSKVNLKNFVDTTYLNFFPSASFEKRFANDNTLTFSYSRRIDRPAYEDMIPFMVIYDKYTANRGNSRLKPQYSNVFELTSTVKKWIIALTHTQISTPITEFGDVNYEKRTFTTTYLNFDNQNITSLNITLPINVTSWWQSNNTLLGVHSSLLLKNYLGSNYDVNWTTYNLNSVNSFSFSNGFSADLVAYYQSPQTAGLYNISAAGSVDVGFKKSFMDKNATLQLTIKDILYTQPYHIGINYQTINIYGFNRSDTRRVGLTFTYKFGKKTVKASDGIEQKNGTESDRLKF